jgi:hypothetical protein
MAENDFTERLNQLLSNPEALSLVMGLAKNFMPQAQASAQASTQPAVTTPAGTPSAGLQPSGSPVVGAQPIFTQPVSSPQQSPPTFFPQQNPTFDPPQQTVQTNSQSDTPEQDGAVQAGLFDKFIPSIPHRHSHTHDRRCALLKAIKPYLKKDRADKVDMLLNVLQISELAQSVFGKFK